MGISSNRDQVRRTLDAWQGEVRALPSALVRAYALEAIRRLVLKTPVDTGRARGNWQVGEGSPDTTVSEATDPNGTRVAGELVARINRLTGMQLVYLTNGLPYIPVLEHGGYPIREGGTAKVTAEGFSRQAPQGMIGVTIAELRSLAVDLSLVIARVRSQQTGGENV